MVNPCKVCGRHEEDPQPNPPVEMSGIPFYVRSQTLDTTLYDVGPLHQMNEPDSLIRTWDTALKDAWAPAVREMLDSEFRVLAAFEGVSEAELIERHTAARKRASRIDRRIRRRVLRITDRVVLTWKTLLHGEPQDWDY